jgi:hypothetical protein
LVTHLINPARLKATLSLINPKRRSKDTAMMMNKMKGKAAGKAGAGAKASATVKVKPAAKKAKPYGK